MGLTSDEMQDRSPCPIMPGCPSHIPSDEKLIGWIKRCRRDPFDWHEFEHKSEEAQTTTEHTFFLILFFLDLCLGFVFEFECFLV